MPMCSIFKSQQCSFPSQYRKIEQLWVIYLKFPSPDHANGQNWSLFNASMLLDKFSMTPNMIFVLIRPHKSFITKVTVMPVFASMFCHVVISTTPSSKHCRAHTARELLFKPVCPSASWCLCPLFSGTASNFRQCMTTGYLCWSTVRCVAHGTRHLYTGCNRTAPCSCSRIPQLWAGHQLEIQ